MLKDERQQTIIDSTIQNDYVTVSELSNSLHVSEMTIRRDITELSDKKKILKIFGGAKKISNIKSERTTAEKMTSNIDSKKYIGHLMNNLIEDGNTIFLGAGTTIFYAIQSITKKNLIIVTNNLLAFEYLEENTNHKIILTGGEFYPRTEEFIGEIASQSLQNININISFAACNGILENDVTFAKDNQGKVQNVALEKSKIKCLIADSSKFDISDTFTLNNLTNFDYLITDNKLQSKQLNHYKQFVPILF